MTCNEPVKNGCEVIHEMFHILNCGFFRLFQVFSVVHITKTVSAFVSLKHMEKQRSLASEVCFRSLKLKFPVISGQRKTKASTNYSYL